MRVARSSVDTPRIIESLVNTLVDVFEATRDLYQTLSIKEKRDYERALRSKGYPPSRRFQYVEDQSYGSDEAIVMDKAAVMRQFEIGYHALGTEFAIGDVIAHTSLQGEIIALQSILVSTFLYGPTSTDPVSFQLSRINEASRATGRASVDLLAALQQRQEDARKNLSNSSHGSRARSSVHSTITYTVTTNSVEPTTPASAKDNEISRVRNGSPVKTIELESRDGQGHGPVRDVETSSVISSIIDDPIPSDLYCPYARDLQRNGAQPLSASIMSASTPTCPHCQVDLHLSPGNAWEVSKKEDGYHRVFQVQNRFIVKCHREGPDGQYACLLCCRSAPVVTICGDVKALVKHLWDDHDARELKHEEDIVEIIEPPVKNRRDSVAGYGASRSTRRSTSPTSSRRRKSLPAYDREVDVNELRSSRRGGN